MSAYHDAVIETLAAEGAELTDRVVALIDERAALTDRCEALTDQVVALVIERDSFRLLSQRAVHLLHACHLEIEAMRAQLLREREHNRDLRAMRVVEPSIALEPMLV